MGNLISCCGVICSNCKVYRTECMGCPDVNGKPYWTKYIEIDVCPIYQCCVNVNNFKNCGKCKALPCAKFSEFKDPSMTDEEHEQTVNNMVSVLKSLEP